MSQARRWVGIGAVAMALLSGCTDQPASAAATVGDVRIEMAEIDEQLRAINDVLGLPADFADAGQTNTILRNNLVYELVGQAAQDNGVSVSATAVEVRLADQIEFVGTQDLLEQQAAQAGVAPWMIEEDVRVSLLAEELAGDLSEGVLSDQETQDLVIREIQRYSLAAPTIVNPRFGTWDATSLSVVSDPEAPSAPATDLGFLGSP